MEGEWHVTSTPRVSTHVLPRRLIIPGVADGLVEGLVARNGGSGWISPHDDAAGSRDGAPRRTVSSSSGDAGGSTAVRIVAFDRVPFGFSGRPSSWSQQGEGGEGGNPYTIDAGACC